MKGLRDESLRVKISRGIATLAGTVSFRESSLPGPSREVRRGPGRW